MQSGEIFITVIPWNNSFKSSDLRINISISEYPKTYECANSGETKGKIVAYYNVSQHAIRKIINSYKKYSQHDKRVGELCEKAKHLPPPERKYGVFVIDQLWYYEPDRYDPNQKGVCVHTTR